MTIEDVVELLEEAPEFDASHENIAFLKSRYGGGGMTVEEVAELLAEVPELFGTESGDN